MHEETQEIFEERIYEEVQTQGDGALELIPKKSFLEKIIVVILGSLVFLMPIFFLPINGVFSGFAKNALLSAVTISALVLTLLLWIKEGKVVLPKSLVFIILFSLVILYTFSSVFSGSFSASFFGTGAEITTSFELLLLTVLAFLFAVFFKTKERIFYTFIALLISSSLVFLFQSIHLIFPGFAITGILPSKTANLIGSWSDLGVFSGIIAIFLLLILEKINIKGIVSRSVLYLFFVISLFFYSLALFSGSWIILGIIALALSIFFYFGKVSQLEKESVSITQQWLATPSFIVAVISLLFVFWGPSINNKFFEVFNIPPVQDVRPSLSGTNQIFLGLFKESKKEGVVGVGPNRFFIPWQKYRPVEVNYTPWWGVDFNEGMGTIPSSLVTVGILGFIGWVSFLLIFFFSGLRALRKRFGKADMLGQYASIATFVGALYCWTVSFVSTVGVVPFSLAFIFTGLFLGSLFSLGAPQVREYSYLKEPQKGFTIVVTLLLLLGATAWFGYNTIERTRSFFAYRNGVLYGESGNVEKSDAELQRAITLYERDAYYRSFSALNSYKAQQIISRKDLSPDELRQQFGASFSTSIDSANRSILIDRANYLNWIVLGNAYSILIPLNIKNVSEDAYTQAKSAYEQAAIRNPFNPQIPFMLAKIALSKNQPDEAKSYIKRTLDLKNDDSDALILLSQIEDSSGHSRDALAVMEGASAINFSDPMVLFQLGYLRYKNGNYEKAASALLKATQAAPDYSNAKYFLGLSYFEFGRTEDAIREFTDIERLNPERTDITQIIHNLQSGYAPLSLPAQENPVSLLTASTTEKTEFSNKKR